jgi:nucleotide-binding universal stress UspA family protein
MNIRRILAPTDFSETSQTAVRYALDLAQKTNARVTLLHAYTLPVYPAGVDGAAFIPSFTALAEPVRMAEAEIGELVARLGPTKVVLDSRTVAGPPADAIIQMARDEAFDLIVMGTHGRTGLRHLLLGSVAERVVRTATTPVLTICHRAADHSTERAVSARP